MPPSRGAGKPPGIKSRYRPAIPVSTDIRNHCHIYLDEGIYINAIALLTDLVIPGAAHPNRSTTPVFAPLPFHIEIISTLLVHPAYTTQLPHNERAELASRSITFLRGLLNILGPLNGNLSEAFSLNPPDVRRATRNRHHGSQGSSESDDDETEPIKGIVANQGRIRRCAKDFWHVVGWAFNCSVVYHKRWKYWKVWLDYMLDVLEEDWRERKEQDLNDESHQSRLQQNPEAQCSYTKLRKSIAVEYLSDVKGRSSAIKRVVGAAFTDGGTDDLRIYPEVFQNESVTFKPKNGHKRKRGDEIDQDFGDFYAANEGDASSPPKSENSTPEPSQSSGDGELAPDPWLGGPESIVLRQRVIALLSCVSAFLPDCFTNLSELYEICCTNLKALPLPALSLLVSPSHSNHLPLEALVSLTQRLQLRLLPNNVPWRNSISNRVNDVIGQGILEECFLPFAASTSSVSDNAKVSLLAENILRLFMKEAVVDYSSKFRAAIEMGIEAREKKTQSNRRKKDKGGLSRGDDNDRAWLAASGNRLRSLVTWVERKAKD